jgi:predicted XRE-type DNA-binding protein
MVSSHFAAASCKAVGIEKQRSLPAMRKKKIKFAEGSGNVFADLGLKDSDELYARAQIGFCVHKIINDKNLKQREIGAVLGIAQSDVSHLMNGHYSRFTTDRLLDFLKRLNRKVTIRIAPHKAGEPYQEISLAS